MTSQLTGSRFRIGIGLLAVFALMAATVAAVLNVRAQGSEDLEIIGPSSSEIFAQGNSFKDDFRVQYRVKFGEADDGEMGMKRNHVSNVDDASNVWMGTLSFAPEENGQVGGVDWHTHPGPFVVAVKEGALTVTWANDCKPRTYEAGEAFVDLGRDIHKAENLSGEETVVYFSVIGVPDGGPITNVVADDDGFEEPC